MNASPRFSFETLELRNTMSANGLLPLPAIEPAPITATAEVSILPAAPVTGNAATQGLTLTSPAFDPTAVESALYDLFGGNAGQSNSLEDEFGGPYDGNDAPIANNNFYNLLHDEVLTTDAPGVLNDDSDFEDDPLEIILVTDVSNGTLTLNQDGSFIYAPNPGFVGTDKFWYKLNDGFEDGNTAFVKIDVYNQHPQGAGDFYSVAHDTELGVTAVAGVLGNDSDPDEDPLTATLLDDVTHGTLSLNANGSFTYTPDSGYLGSDSFTYMVSDGLADVAPFTVTISVYNQAPETDYDGYATALDTTLTVTAATGVLANDLDPQGDDMTAELVDDVQHGSLSFNTDGSFSYTPAAGFSGTDSFTYKVSDGLDESDPITVTLTVRDNIAPYGYEDAYTLWEAPYLPIDFQNGVLSNDGDADGDDLTAVLISGPSFGSLQLSTDGSFNYTADVGYIGTDWFVYRVSDGITQSGDINVSILVLYYYFFGF